MKIRPGTMGSKKTINNKTVPNIHLDQNSHGKVLHIIVYLLLKPILRNKWLNTDRRSC